jgi:hypothetical protein
VIQLRGFVVTFRWWIAAALGGVALLLGLLWLVIYPARRVDARDENRLALAGRADQQHALVLAGDDRGTYGQYPPQVWA